MTLQAHPLTKKTPSYKYPTILRQSTIKYHFAVNLLSLHCITLRQTKTNEEDEMKPYRHQPMGSHSNVIIDPLRTVSQFGDTMQVNLHEQHKWPDEIDKVYTCA